VTLAILHHHTQEKLAKFGYNFFREESRPNFVKESCYIFGGTYCLNIVNSELFFPLNLATLGAFFQPLYELH